MEGETVMSALPVVKTGTNPLKGLLSYGQSVWLDFIRRSLLTSGELERLITEDGLRGVTSNPAIFEKDAPSVLHSNKLGFHHPNAIVSQPYERQWPFALDRFL